MSTRVRSWDRSACVARVASGLERLAVVVTGVYLGVALIAGVRSLSVGDVIYLAGFGVVMGAMGVVCVACFRDVRTDVYVRAAAVSAAGVLVAAGLFDLGWVYAEIGLLLAMAATTVFVARRMRARRRTATLAAPVRHRRPVPAQRAVDVVAEPVAVDPAEHEAADPWIEDTMTDLDLCQAWRSSYVALERACSAASRGTIVTTRVVLLDELERRHPAEVRAWLESGARAASGPERFVLRDGRGDQVLG